MSVGVWVSVWLCMCVSMGLCEYGSMSVGVYERVWVCESMGVCECGCVWVC